MKLHKGEIIIDVHDLARSEEIMREIAKQALFDDLLLHAISQVAITGEILWSDDEPPWWSGSSSHDIRFERLRSLITSIADETARKAYEEMQKERDDAEKGYNIYQARAWRAENIVEHFKGALLTMCGEDERTREQIQKTCNVKAHAQETDL
jgi:hypothetical protein